MKQTKTQQLEARILKLEQLIADLQSQLFTLSLQRQVTIVPSPIPQPPWTPWPLLPQPIYKDSLDPARV